MLYKINKDIFNNNKVKLKPTISYDNDQEDYDKFIDKLKLFINLLYINANVNVNEIVYDDKRTIKKVIFDN
jgi:hypothetical protein